MMNKVTKTDYSMLKSGLEFFIKEVEKLDDTTIFKMNLYSDCVIGKTINWDDDIDDSILVDPDVHVASKYFGVTTKQLFDHPLFSRSSGILYDVRTWRVIRLFTSHYGVNVLKKDWLIRAKEELEQQNRYDKVLSN